MDQFKGIKPPPLRNTRTKFDNCPKINQSRRSSNETTTSPFCVPKNNGIGSSGIKADKETSIYGEPSKFQTPEAPSYMNSSKSITQSERASLIRVYIMMFLNFMMPIVTSILGVVFHGVFVMMLMGAQSSGDIKSGVFMSLGIAGILIIAGVLWVIFNQVAPWIISLMRRNDKKISDDARTHYVMIARAYFVTLCLFGISFVSTLLLGFLIGPGFEAVIAILSILFSIIAIVMWIVYFIKHISGFLSALRYESFG